MLLSVIRFGLTAQGVETIQRKGREQARKTCASIEALIKEYQVEKIVLGFPKHMNNDIGERAEKSLEFREMLVRRTGLEKSSCGTSVLHGRSGRADTDREWCETRKQKAICR